MTSSPICVIGAGGCARALTAYLCTTGHPVRILEHPSFVPTLKDVLRGLPLRYRGDIGEGGAGLEVASTDASIVEGCRWLIVNVPAYGHEPFARLLAPHLSDSQVVVVSPGPAMGAFAFRHHLAAYGCMADLTFVETNTVWFSGVIDSSGVVTVNKTARDVLFSALPARDTSLIADDLRAILPWSTPATSVLELAMESLHIMSHPAPTVLNAGLIEHARGDFPFYHETVSPSVARVMERQDEERLRLATALGLDMPPHREAIARLLSPNDPDVEIPATIYDAYRSPKLTGAVVPDSLDHRYLTEDVPYGLVPWVSMARHLGIPMPVSEMLVDVASTLIGTDHMRIGRTLDSMGLDHVDRPETLIALAAGGG